MPEGGKGGKGRPQFRPKGTGATNGTSSSGGKRGRGKGKARGGKGGAKGGGGETSAVAGVSVDPAKAKGVLFKWLQKTHQVTYPAEYVSLETSGGKGRRGHGCTAWVWVPEQEDWITFEAEGNFPNRQEATAAAYAAAVEGLEIPIPKDCLLSEEGLAKQKTRSAEEKKKAQQAQQRADIIEACLAKMEADIIKALFGSEQGPFFTPREREEEQPPKTLAPRLRIPPHAEARHGEDKGNKFNQTMKTLVKKEPNLLEGPHFWDEQKSAPGGAMHISVCAMLFDKNIAILGSAVGPKRGAARAAAARECLSRLDTSPALPSREESGENGAAVAELRRLQAIQPFKVWALEGVIPGDQTRWYCALWGQVPFQGGLRDFWGEGASSDSKSAVAEACGEAAGRLTSLLGSCDCVSWIKASARVVMEVEDVPSQTLRTLLESTNSRDNAQSYAAKVRKWLEEHATDDAWEPVDLSEGAAPTVPQTYEPEEEDGPLETARVARGAPKLPAGQLRKPVSETLEDCPSFVVSGGTGSGKSTQIPQYILDDYRADSMDDDQKGYADDDDGPKAWKGPPRIVVTEPRRIAAISLAERVAWERGEQLGDSVGYAVRGDSKPPRGSKSKNGSIEYVTVGILLRRIQRDPNLSNISHVLIDEVHERDLMTDFLLILLKELLCARSDFRVCLMSATLDVHTFTSYFWDAPCLEVPTGPRFTVEEIHLEDDFFKKPWAGDLAPMLLQKEEEARKAEEEARAEEDDEQDETAEQSMYRASTGLWWGSAENDDTFLDLLCRMVMKLSEEGDNLVDDEGQPGSILCFLPGWAEIKIAVERLEEMDYREKKLWVVPLHSTLPKAEQNLIFQRPPAGKTKIILGTNIAESSVTIDDVLVVVDCGLAREVSYDPVRRISVLETVWVSQSSAIQRMGRAGRVRKGRCYRFYSRAQLEQAPWRSAPEMQRCELASTCLQALALRREARDFLARAPDPPTRAAVESALEELLQLGAVCPEKEGSTGHMREQMMPLGDALSRMTLSPTLGRMLMLGALFGVAQEAALLAAVIAAPRRVFVCPPGKKKESLACMRGFSSASDTLAAYLACMYYAGWKASRGEPYADRWASDLFLVAKRLRGLLASKNSYLEELQRVGLGPSAWNNRNWSSWQPDDECVGWGGAEGRDECGGDVIDDDDGLLDVDEPDDGIPKVTAKEAKMELVKALLVSAYPMNLALRRRIGNAKHNTSTGLDAIIAPQSVNAAPKGKPDPNKDRSGDRIASWWAYGSMHISNRQGFLRATSLVDPYHVALMGGLSVMEDDHGAMREIDGWIELRGGRATLRALARLREEVFQSIHVRALDPRSEVAEGVQAVLREVKRLLHTAVPRQERISQLLPDQVAHKVEEPPPPPPPEQRYRNKSRWRGNDRGYDDWEGGYQERRGKGKGGSKGNDRKGSGKGGRGSSWKGGWDDGWGGGWEQSSWDNWDESWDDSKEGKWKAKSQTKSNGAGAPPPGF